MGVGKTRRHETSQRKGNERRDGWSAKRHRPDRGEAPSQVYCEGGRSELYN